MGAITSVTVTPDDPTAFAVTDYTITFTAATAMPRANMVYVTFDTGFDVSGQQVGGSIGYPGYGSFLDPTGGMTRKILSGFAAQTYFYQASVSGQQVGQSLYCTATLGTCDASVTLLPAGTPVSLRLYGITNPAADDYTVSVSTTLDTTPGSDTVTITGGATAPTVTTVAASNITATAARLNGTILTNGAEVTAASVTWGTASDLAGGTTTTITSPSLPIADSESAVAAYLDISGLTPETQYYYRMKATNSEGESTNTAILSFYASVSARYRVGAGGNWTADMWSLTAGGATGASVPQYTNDVYIDANASGTITLDADAYTASIDFTGFAGSVTFDGNDLRFHGDFVGGADVTWDDTPSIIAVIDSDSTIDWAGNPPFTTPQWVFRKQGVAKLTALDTWPFVGMILKLDRGEFDQNGQAWRVRRLEDDEATGAATFTATDNWKITDTLKLAQATTTKNTDPSTLTFEPSTDFISVQVGTAGIDLAQLINLKGDDTGNQWQVSGPLRIGTLTLAAGVAYPFTSSAAGTSVSQIVSGGSGGDLVELTGTGFTLIATGQIITDYLDITDVPVTGITPAYAGANSTLTGTTTGWLAEAPAPSRGLMMMGVG